MNFCLFFFVCLWTLLHVRANRSNRRNFYIDLGANDGNSIQSFISGTSSQHTAGDGSKSLQGGWKELTKGHYLEANQTRAEWHVIAVEANSNFNDKLFNLQSRLLEQKKVSTMKIYNGTAISTKNGHITFIWDAPNEGHEGATTMVESYSAIGRKITIPALDIVTLFKHERITVHDFVVVKMDVEGAEYELVRRILLMNLWQYIDRLAVEWHHNAYFVFGHPGSNTSEPRYQERLDNHIKYTKIYESIQWMVEGLDNKWKIFNWGR